MQAWDGWCNYGIAENKDIKYVIPKEGSDLWVDTMVVMKASENKDAAFQFINFMLDAKNHAWAAQNILYKVPNKPAMESLPAELLDDSSRTWRCRSPSWSSSSSCATSARRSATIRGSSARSRRRSRRLLARRGLHRTSEGRPGHDGASRSPPRLPDGAGAGLAHRR